MRMKCADPSGTRLRRSVLCSCIGAACLVPGGILAAEGEQNGRREFSEGQRIERIMPASGSMQSIRRFDGEGPPSPRRAGYGDPRAPGLTPEERRQLRRDIRDAGRELYRDAPDR